MHHKAPARIDARTGTGARDPNRLSACNGFEQMRLGQLTEHDLESLSCVT